MYKQTSTSFKATTLISYILHCTENYVPQLRYRYVSKPKDPFKNRNTSLIGYNSIIQRERADKHNS